MTLLSNSLADLAERVKEAAASSALAERTGIEKALEAGRFLCEAKAKCRHGEWLPFLDRAGIKERRARQYMQLARSGLESATIADLGGIGAALQWLSAFSMPEQGETLVVSLDGFADGVQEPMAFIWGDGGGFHVAMIDLNEASPHGICTIRPVQDERAARMTLYRLIDYHRMTTAQNLDRSITIRRVVGTPNELGEIVGGTEQDVLTVRASRQDVSDGEKFAAGGIGGYLTARFIVRSTARTRGIRPSDKIRHDGKTWNLKGIKERDEGRRRFIELTATVNADG